MSPVLVLLALTALRLVVAAATPLSADEAYYWTWSRALAGGYLDHPPMVALWIRAGTALAGETALGVRLLAPLSAAAGSVLLADAANRLFPGRRLGVPAATMLNATLMLGAGAVTMTPDTPLIFFWTLCLWALVRAPGQARYWLVVGAAAGLALDSKYTAALLGVAVLAWLAWVPGLRRQFRSAWLWLGGGVAVLCVLPMVAWNAQHGWASFLKQGGRTADWRPAEAAKHLGELLAGQAGLATPLLFVLFVAGVWAALRGAARRDPAWSLLAALTVPAALVFIQHAVGDRVQANWVAILYPAASVAAAALGWRWWRAASGLGLALTVLVYLQAAAAPFHLPRRLDPTLIRLAGWDGLAAEAEALRQREGLGFVAAEEYGLASLLAWWLPGRAVLGTDPRFAFVALQRMAPGGAGLLVASARRSEPPDPAIWAEAAPLGRLIRSRSGVEAEAFIVYRVRLRTGADAALLAAAGG